MPAGGVVGLGTQVIEVARVRRLLERHAERFLDRVFTPEEQAFGRARARSAEPLAALWAAKEATLRSLGATWHKGIDWTDIEIVTGDAPELRAELRGALRALGDRRGAGRIAVATAHTRLFATATALALAE